MTGMTAQTAATPSLALERRQARLSGHLDLGVEPAIEADGGRRTPDDRRLVSFRWLAGIVLAGFAGAALISAAVYSALDRQYNFAEAPQAAAPPRRDAPGGEADTRKGDRLVKSIDIIAAKQTFKTPTTIAAGDKEVVRVRTFTRVATSLTLASAGFADEVPRFDPMKLLEGSRNAAPGEQTDPGPLQDEAEVAFSTRDLNGIDLPDTGAGLSPEEVQAQVTEHLKNALAGGARASIPLPPQLLLMRTSRVGLDAVGGLSFAAPAGGVVAAPFSNIEVRMVPENVTTLARTQTPADRKSAEERLVVVRKNESIEEVLRAAGAGRDLIRGIVTALNTRRGQAPVSEGQRVKLLFADVNGPDQPPQIARLSIYTDEKLEATVAMADSGAFVQVERAPPAPAAARQRRRAADEDDDEEDSGGMRLYDSFYETALKSELPRPVIDDLVRIFANDVDFQRSVAGGDNFEVFYEDGEEGEARNEILHAAITTRNETFKYFRFQTPDDSLVDFYDENGRSTRKFLVRKPIATGETRSGFGMRRHPILGYARMHTGVDWAAPIGTPIFAAGNGTVIKAGRESGYGNRVEIQHANGYITTYNHMSGFARGISEGMRIRQGTLVGYLGMTGLATGPHLHYEVIVNGHFVDPLAVKLARTRELDGRMIALFKRERDRIDGLIAKTPGAARIAAKQASVN